MIVINSGWYRTRDGEFAEVVVNSAGYGVTGYIYPHLVLQRWGKDGTHDMDQPVTDGDLVEYLGKERPAQKKVVRMAPAMFRNDRDYYVSASLFESEKEAKKVYTKNFVRWLIDTPYAIDVEVPDNG